ncbi:MAG: benzoate/H(+) symporter BenE family transporter [Geminicoccaceae bacterium]
MTFSLAKRNRISIGPFINALQAGLKDENRHFAATTTFLVTASGISVLGIGPAFRGLVAGLVIILLGGIGARKPA